MPCWGGGHFDCLEKRISEGFASYGRWASRNPRPLITLPLLLSAGLAVGMIRLSSLKGTEEVYTPMHSQSKQDQSTIKSMFPDRSATIFHSQNLVTLGHYIEIIGRVKGGSGSILQLPVLNEVAKLRTFVLNLRTKFQDRNVNFSQVCARNQGNCVIDGDYLLSSSFQSMVQGRNIPYPSIATSTVPVFVEDFLGDLTVSGGKVTEAKYFKLRFNLREDSAMIDASKAIEDAFTEQYSQFQASLCEFSFSTSRSMDQELDKAVSGDVVFFSLTFTLMIVYMSLIVVQRNMVATRASLARWGVISTGLGVVAGLGLVCATGLQFVQIVGIVPFLVIGVGIDDVFILLSGLAKSYDEREEGVQPMSNKEDVDKIVERHISETLRTSGVAITITSATNVLALAIGASSVFVGVRNFSVYGAVAFLMTYINHVTFFTGCMVLHERRVHRSRHAHLWCNTISTPEEARTAQKSWLYINCYTGSIPRSRREVENAAEWFPGWVSKRLMGYLHFRISVIVSFVALLGVGIWGATMFRSDFKLSDLAVDGSPFKTYNEWKTRYFKQLEPLMVVLQGTKDYRTQTVQTQIDGLLSELKQDSAVDPTFELNWLKDFRTASYYDNSSPAAFISSLRNSFLKQYIDYENDIIFSSDNTSITASRFYVRMKDQNTSESQGKSMVRVRDIASASDLGAICYGQGFVFYEQYVAIVPNTFQTVGVAAAAVFVVNVLFMPNILIILYMTLTLAVSLVAVFGYMHFWGLTLSSITMIHTIMCVGFVVDYESHICHAYLVADGDTRLEKVKNALRSIAGPITHGTVSSILGLILLVVSKSFIFRSFFQVMFLVIMLSFGQAVLFLPAVLSFVGPLPNKQDTKTESHEMNARS